MKKEIINAMEELKNAMLESIEIKKQQVDIDLLVQANHYRLLKAKEEVRALERETQ